MKHITVCLPVLCCLMFASRALAQHQTIDHFQASADKLFVVDPGPPVTPPTPGERMEVMMKAMDAYDRSHANTEAARKEASLKDSPVYTFLTDRLELIFQPQFGNTIPNVFGTPSLALNKFELQSGVVQLSYTLPLDKVWKNDNSKWHTCFLDFWSFGITGSLNPPDSKFRIGQPVLQLLDSLQGSLTVYAKLDVDFSKLRAAIQKKDRQGLIKAQQAEEKARHELMQQMYSAISEIQRSKQVAKDQPNSQR